MHDRRQIIRAAIAAPLACALPGWARAATPPTDDVAMARFIAGLPKAEFHVHLEGTLEAEMKFALAKRNNLSLPYADVEAMKRSYIYHDLPSFLKIYYDGMQVLLTEQDFYDLAYGYLSKAASQNVLYAEMFFDPQEHLKRGVPIEAVIGGITRARADAAKTLGIQSQLILCFMRDLSAASAMEALDAALPYKDKLVGVGLDSDEKGNPPEKFAEHFAKARAAGLHVTMHCDVNQENTLGNIRTALVDLKAERIDHGGNIVQSPELVALAKSLGIPFTVCPTFSGKVMDDGQPINALREMLDAGLKVSVNSDDPAYMGSEYITEVLVRAQKDSALTPAELVRIERNAFETAWIPAEQRDGYLARLDAYAQSWDLTA
ncbi:adenosine deaminase [Novosphingobium mangrovi (ex Huang et al. 2023)]|uniref:Adenine deaminase n=1 Tax=Novosphingobium mangrovi (ex Huang et al. 2023) TaxID=2976432 RepID=A0ABT2I2U5_9SPHN|nr:adenosine deaminase [Novosphingobium mangrovi (ex Huang et al. 2023)]MCT2399126.1 adenosine deaminase [Novosphingobium mangrovi (ex Huang et al. 2023)]